MAQIPSLGGLNIGNIFAQPPEFYAQINGGPMQQQPTSSAFQPGITTTKPPPGLHPNTQQFTNLPPGMLRNPETEAAKEKVNAEETASLKNMLGLFGFQIGPAEPDLQTQQLKELLKIQTNETKPKQLSEAKSVAIRGKEGLYCLDCKSKAPTDAPLLKSCFISMFTQDGSLLIGADTEGISAFDPDTLRLKHKVGLEAIQSMILSPGGKYLQIWNKVDKDFQNIALLEISSFKIIKSFILRKFKKEQWPILRFTGDDRLAFRQNGNIIEVLGVPLLNKIDEVTLECVDVYSISPSGRRPIIACGEVQNINRKNTPKVVFIDLENKKDSVFVQEIDKAHEINFIWAPDGEACLIWSQTLHDETGKSYYGEHVLYYYRHSTKEFIAVPKAEGPVHDVSWNPNSQEFILLSGFMPATCVMFDKTCAKKFEFNKLYANTIRWSPLSRFLLLGGFGNLSGGIQVWDMTTQQKIGDCKALSAITCSWAPDGRKFNTAIINPRLRVDNGFRVFSYAGEQLNYVDMRTTELYEVIWRPGKFEDRPPTPGRKSEATTPLEGAQNENKKQKRVMKLREEVDFIQNPEAFEEQKAAEGNGNGAHLDESGQQRDRNQDGQRERKKKPQGGPPGMKNPNQQGQQGQQNQQQQQQKVDQPVSVIMRRGQGEKRGSGPPGLTGPLTQDGVVGDGKVSSGPERKGSEVSSPNEVPK